MPETIQYLLFGVLCGISAYAYFSLSNKINELIRAQNRTALKIDTLDKRNVDKGMGH